MGFTTFAQLALSVPLRGNPDEGNDDYYEDNDDPSVFDYVVPDGIGAHLGYGVFYNSWIGISANTGIDFVGQQKLVTTPVYGMLTLTPFLKQEYGLLFQVGLGHTFALGRGNLSGTYQKYRLGAIIGGQLSIHFEANLYGFPIYDFREAGSISIGVSLLDFLKK